MADTTYIRDSVSRKLRDMGDGSFAEVVHAPPAIADSIGSGGSVASIGATAAFVTVAAPPVGVYDVSFGYFLSGTAETATANVRLRKGTTNIITPMPSISAAPPVTDDVKRISLDGSTNLSLQSIAAGVAGAVYNGWIIATKVG